MSNLFKYALGAVAIAVAVLAVRSFVGVRDAEWQARVGIEMARAEEALAANDSLREQAANLQLISDSLVANAVEQDTVIIRMIEELPAPPAEAEPFTAPRDSVITAQQEHIETLSDALTAQREASGLLAAAEAEARAAADSLYAVLDDRPRPLSPLIPSLGLGATAGICTTGQPCVAVGLTLSWEVKLF